MLSMFVSKDNVIYEMDSRVTKKEVVSDGKGDLDFENIVLLTDNRTASVSELFVLALKSNLQNVKVIGTNSYGKNISYSIRRFNDDSAMIFISSIMKGPKASQIDINGIEPDIKVGHNEEYYTSINNEAEQKQARDSDAKEQLEEALKYIKVN